MQEEPARPAVSFVVPVFDEEGNVANVHADVTQAGRALGRPYEVVFVNDGSADRTLERLERLVARDPCVRVVDFDGNFGQSAALSAGYAHARGDLVCSLDGDGQNDPRDLPKLLAALTGDVAVVTGFRRHREGNFFTRVLPSRVANLLVGWVTRIPVSDCGCSLKLYRREVLQEAALPAGMHRFLPAVLGVRAAQVAEVEVSDRPRGSGRSHYGLSRTFVVLRDLVGLPLVLRRRPSRATARLLRLGSLAAAIMAVGMLAIGHPLFAGASAVVSGLLAAAWHTVIRFVGARERGVYRVRCVLGGAQATGLATPSAARLDAS